MIDIIRDLTYINYAHNRRRSPHISPESWRKVYGETADAMEKRFQAEKFAEAHEEYLDSRANTDGPYERNDDA
jgi:hypothetical protein